MATNNNAHTLDSAGNPVVDFVWGNFPLQPNDVRTETSAANFGGAPTFVVTDASVSSNTVTLTVTSNTIPAGAYVNVTGLSNDKFEVQGAQVLTSSSTQITYLDANAAGESSLTGETGTVIWAGDKGFAATTKLASDRLDFDGYTVALNNGITKTVGTIHELEETGYSGYPTYSPAAANYMITAVSGDGTTVTYTSQNNFLGGETVNITGLSASAYNLSSATVATANKTSFTVTNSANAGLLTGQYGKVQSTTALTGSDGSYIAGVAYIDVPSVLGVTTAIALDTLKDAGYAAANITTASGATNTATQPTRINVTATTAATVYVSGGTSTWPVGTKVTIASGTGIPTALVGTWSVTGGSGSTLVIAGSGWTVADTGSITPGTALTGATGTIKTQSTAAGATSQSLSATITITPWA